MSKKPTKAKRVLRSTHWFDSHDPTRSSTARG